jgi:hypothetical protein
VPEELKKLPGSAGVSVTRMGAIYSEKLEGLIVPLHHWYRFFIQGKKRKW